MEQCDTLKIEPTGAWIHPHGHMISMPIGVQDDASYWLVPVRKLRDQSDKLFSDLVLEAQAVSLTTQTSNVTLIQYINSGCPLSCAIQTTTVHADLEIQLNLGYKCAV